MGLFGNPVTNETLEGLPRYKGKTIGAVDRARVALRWKNAEGKDVKALQYAQNLKEVSGYKASTFCLFYNATGDTVEYADHVNWEGTLGAAPYPAMIENGQWGVIHHRNVGDSGNVGAVVYRGTNAENKDCDWMLAWNNRGPIPYNTAYTEVRPANHFNCKWDQEQKNLKNSRPVHKSDSDGCLSFVTIGDVFSHSIFSAVLTLKNANKNESSLACHC